MVSITALVVPIVLCAVFVFIASSLIHMALGYHRADYERLPDQPGLVGTLRQNQPGPGLYFFPYCTHKDMKTPEVLAEFNKGPVGFLTILPSGPPAMGRNLGSWFALSLFISAAVAWITSHGAEIGAAPRHVWALAGPAAFLGYGAGPISNWIWAGQPASNTARAVLDALIYAVVIAATLAWRWPR